MKNIYTARFYDYYDNEIERFTQSFERLDDCAAYFYDICDEHAIPFAQMDRNDQAINWRGHRIGADCDSRAY